MSVQLADRMAGVKPSAIRELLRLGDDPSIISFGGGYPDPSLFPMDDLAAVFADLLTPRHAASLQYTASIGLPRLRQQLAARLTGDGMPCTADNLLVLQGGQQGLDLVAKLLLNPGDQVVVEDPTFLGALIAFNPCQPRYLTVPMDGEGMDTQALEAVLAAHPEVKLIYTVPDFQNPAGVTMSLARRHHLVELAGRFDVVVLEDTPYRELRYEGEQLPTLKSLDTGGRVIHLGSFSKILAPGLRLGWVLAEPRLLSGLALLKLAADTQCSTLNMAAASAYLDRFDLDAHIAVLRSSYRHKRDLALATIERCFPDTVRHTRAQGGLFTWVTFAEGFDAAVFMRDRALPQARVAYVPGATFFAVHEQPNHARLSFSALSDEQLTTGLERLGALLHG
jgi:2-aminoadipate transaminase